MIVVAPMEIIITPETTYVALELFNTRRRIYTDGRDWPAKITPVPKAIRSAIGSIARGDGRSTS